MGRSRANPVRSPEVRLWHITEVPLAFRDFRFRALNGHDITESRLGILSYLWYGPASDFPE